MVEKLPGEITKPELWRRFWWLELRKRWFWFLVAPFGIAAAFMNFGLYFLAFCFVVWYVIVLSGFASLFMEWVPLPVTVVNPGHVILVPDFNATSINCEPSRFRDPPASPPQPDPE